MLAIPTGLSQSWPKDCLSSWICSNPSIVQWHGHPVGHSDDRNVSTWALNSHQLRSGYQHKSMLSTYIHTSAQHPRIYTQTQHSIHCTASACLSCMSRNRCSRQHIKPKVMHDIYDKNSASGEKKSWPRLPGSQRQRVPDILSRLASEVLQRPQDPHMW